MSGMPISGSSHWAGEHRVIEINGDDAAARQRFTLFHELKHIVDHGQNGATARKCIQ